jgi:hypothetical protein
MTHLGIQEIVLIFAVVALFGIVKLIPYWRIFKRAGFPPALSLLMLVPLVNLVVLYFLGFARWPGFEDGKS